MTVAAIDREKLAGTGVSVAHGGLAVPDKLDELATQVNTNAATGVTNAATGVTNAAGIATNVTNIGTNTSGVSTNVTNIGTNTSGVSTNVTDIATNTSAIGSIVHIKRIAMSDRGAGAHLLEVLHATKDALVLEVYVDVATLESSGTTTVDLGVESVEAAGLADDLSVASAVLVRAEAEVTAGGTETYYSANTRGILNSDFIVGTNTNSDFGLYREKPYVLAGGVKLEYTVPSGGWTEFIGDLIVMYVEIPA